MKLKALLISLFLLLELFVPHSTVYAIHDNCEVYNASGAAGAPPPSIHDLECVYRNFVHVIAPLAGVVAFIFIAYSGFKFITAQGDQKAVASAKTSLTIAILGLIAVILAYFILDILSMFSGANLRQFTVPRP